jgi:hypothetical protein
MNKTRSSVRPWWLVAVGVAAAWPQTAAAQAENTVGFSVERFTPAPGPDAYFVAESADVLAHGALSLSLTGSLMRRPVVLARLGTDEEVATPVDVRLGYELGGALGLAGRFQIGLALPVVAAQHGDRLRGIGFDETALAPFALGDLRVHAKARLLGNPGGTGFGVAAAVASTVPTGDEENFAGEAGVVVDGLVIAGWRSEAVSVAVNLGPRWRSEDVVLFAPSRRHGNELLVHLAADAAVPRVLRRRLRALVEVTRVFGECTAEVDGACTLHTQSPGEIRLGARLGLGRRYALTFGYGAGITPDEVGSPTWRIFAGVRFLPPAAPAPVR